MIRLVRFTRLTQIVWHSLRATGHNCSIVLLLLTVPHARVFCKVARVQNPQDEKTREKRWNKFCYGCWYSLFSYRWIDRHTAGRAQSTKRSWGRFGESDRSALPCAIVVENWTGFYFVREYLYSWTPKKMFFNGAFEIQETSFQVPGIFALYLPVRDRPPIFGDPNRSADADSYEQRIIVFDNVLRRRSKQFFMRMVFWSKAIVFDFFQKQMYTKRCCIQQVLDIKFVSPISRRPKQFCVLLWTSLEYRDQQINVVQRTYPHDDKW